MTTVKQAAEQLNLSEQRIRQLCASGQLKAERVGRDWIIDGKALAKYRPGPAGWRKGRSRKTHLAVITAPAS